MTRVVEYDFANLGLKPNSLRRSGAEARIPVQMSLFPSAEPNVIVTMVLNRDASSFWPVINDVHVRMMFDLRTSPRFDFHGMNRKDVFASLHHKRIRYFDVSGSLGSGTVRESRISPVLLGDYIRPRIGDVSREGPRLALLIDDRYDDPEYVSQLAAYISPKVSAWNWMRISGPANELGIKTQGSRYVPPL